MTDLVFLHLLAGNGGHGRVSFRREKYVAKGGPDGGDGGSGGNIIIRGNKTINTLREYAGRIQYAADHGAAGAKKKMTGAKGEDIILDVPIGTTIWQVSENMVAHKRRIKLGGVEELLKRDQIGKERYELFKEGEFIPERESDDLLDQDKINEVKRVKKFDPEVLELIKLAEVTEHDQRVVVAQGGVGGRGNDTFKSPSLTTPLLAEYGSFGEQRLVALELKLLADVGLVGFPNAGKSTLISRLTSSRPKVASYPFTTLEPHLGIYRNPQTQQELVIADIPGLIEGASQGKGLGFQFLRHIENCSVLLYVLALDDLVVQDDTVTAQQKAEYLWSNYQTLQKELKDYKQTAFEKPAYIVVNKIDLFAEGQLAEIEKYFQEKKTPVLFISAATGEGLDALHKLLAKFA